MKITVSIILLLLSAHFFCNCQNTLEKEHETVVNVNSEQRFQTIEGWGSSLCWWAGQVGNWEESKVDSIIDLITSPDGLNLNWNVMNCII